MVYYEVRLPAGSGSRLGTGSPCTALHSTVWRAPVAGRESRATGVRVGHTLCWHTIGPVDGDHQSPVSNASRVAPCASWRTELPQWGTRGATCVFDAHHEGARHLSKKEPEKLQNGPENALANLARSKGWTPSKRGWPDFICYGPDGQFIAIEVKPRYQRGLCKGELRSLTGRQALLMGKLQSAGIRCYVSDGETLEKFDYNEHSPKAHNRHHRERSRRSRQSASS